VIPSQQNILDFVVAVSAFAAVLSVWFFGVLLWSVRRASRAREVKERLEIFDLDRDTGRRILRLWHEDRGAGSMDSGQARRPSFLQRLKKKGRDAEGVLPLRTHVIGMLAVPLLLFMLTLVTIGRVMPAVGTAIAAIIIFRIYVKQRVAKHAKQFETQFVEALDLAARSLRAGHPLTGAFHLISEEIPAPVGTVFKEICQQQELGISLEDAIRKAATQSSSPDIKLFAPSVIVPLRSGGSLAGMMERLAAVVRDRIRLNRRIRVLAAQTEFSKRVLLALPFLMFVTLNIVNPEYMEPLYTTPVGKLLLAGGGVCLLLGSWVMNRMADIRY
jgi:tight adherence protein B